MSWRLVSGLLGSPSIVDKGKLVTIKWASGLGYRSLALRVKVYDKRVVICFLVLRLTKGLIIDKREAFKPLDLSSLEQQRGN